MYEPSAGAGLFLNPQGTKRYRFDQGSARGVDIAPGRGSLLRTFGAWGAEPREALERGRAEAAIHDRRGEARHHHVECLAWVGWKTFRRFHMKDALMVNVSRGGALIFLDAPPPKRKPVWVFLETPRLNTIVKARVLDVATTGQGQCTIRVEFHEPCPYEVFETAVCGLAPADPKVRARARAGARLAF